MLVAISGENSGGGAQGQAQSPALAEVQIAPGLPAHGAAG